MSKVVQYVITIYFFCPEMEKDFLICSKRFHKVTKENNLSPHLHIPSAFGNYFNYS